MRALVVRRYGPPEVFEVQETADPQPKPGEVLIRVKTIGVNFADLVARMGIYSGAPKPPFVPGFEIAGVVEKIAPGPAAAENQPLRPGDAVAAVTQFNAYAQWVSLPARQVFRLPSGMTFEHAAAIPVNYLVAYHAMFTMGNLQAGDRLLIHGAAGGVGTAAVQLARSRGLVIFGTASRTKQEYLRKSGVNHAIDHEKSDFLEVVRKYAPDGIEMVMDPIGGKSFQRSYKCLGPNGRLVVYGFSAAAGSDGKRSLLRSASAFLQTPWFHPLKLLTDGIAVIGVNLGRLESRPALLRSELDEIFRLYAAGTVKPVVAKIFPFADGAAAHQYLQDRKNIGKVILTVK